MTFEQNPPFSPSDTAPYVPQPSGTVTQRAGLGVTALAIAIPVFVLSLIASVLVGITAGQITPVGSGTFSDGFTDGYAAGAENVGFGVAVLAHIVLGSLLGGAALVIGIIAIALKRGRGQGIAAVIVAGTAPIVSFLVYIVAAGVVAATRVM